MSEANQGTNFYQCETVAHINNLRKPDDTERKERETEIGRIFYMGC